MYIVKRKNNIRLIYCINKKVNIENSSARYKVIVTVAKYKVQIRCLWFWITIKEFDEDEYYDAVDCFRYCTNPYIN